MTTPHQIIKVYFDNPEKKNSVLSAAYAYQDIPLSKNINAHAFTSQAKDATCHYCKRTRESVRWDWEFERVEYRCFKGHFTDIDIRDSIKTEEEKFFAMIKSKESLVISFKDKLTGENLSWLHQTHGINPDIVEDILLIKISSELRDEYNKCYNIHRQTGRDGFEAEIIKI